MGEIKCDFMNKRGYDDYYCNKVKHNVSYDTFIKYCTEYSYDECPNYTACYISTAVCNELGKMDELEVLKQLRYDIMENDEKYSSILSHYDKVAHGLATRLATEKDTEIRKNLATNLFNFYIKPTSDLVSANEIDKAIALYQGMVEVL